jgi:hypothetical protein
MSQPSPSESLESLSANRLTGSEDNAKTGVEQDRKRR